MAEHQPQKYLFEDKGLFHAFVDSMREGVYFLDPARRIQYWNAGARRISGFSADDVLGKHCANDILKHVDESGNNLCKGECPMAQTIADGVVREKRLFLHRKDGHRVSVEVCCVQIRDAKGRVAGALETFREAPAQNGADSPARVCPMTGVPNRVYAEEELAAKLEAMRQQHLSLGVLFAGVDRIIHINDHFGKHIGDLALKMAARSLSSGLRPNDILARWAGVEFLAILPGIKHIEVRSLAERLRMLVENSSREVSQDRMRVTVSIGACVCRLDDTAQSVINKVDRCMRESRAHGGNRVTMD